MMQYLKTIKIFVAIFIATGAYAMDHSLASHLEVSMFRLQAKGVIAAKKVALNTRLDVVAALAVLEERLEQQGFDRVKFVRLVLGMINGNGYRDGVTSNLVANAREKQIIERVVKKALESINLVDFKPDYIWTNHLRTPLAQHAGVLNAWERAVAQRAMVMIAPDNAQPYDVQIAELERPLVYNPPANIVPAAAAVLAPEFNRLIQGIIIPFGMAARGGTLMARTTQLQRNSIRACTDEIDKIQNKEPHLGLLLNKIAPILSQQPLTPGIVRQIQAIDQRPVIRTAASAQAIQGLQDCMDAIKGLPALDRDRYYNELTVRVRGIIPAFSVEPTEGEMYERFIKRLNGDPRRMLSGILASFSTTHSRAISSIITARLEAITPPLDPAPVVANPDDAIDFLLGIYRYEMAAIPHADDAGKEQRSITYIETRLKNFLLNHWSNNYKPEAVAVPAVDTDRVKNTLQAKFTAINVGPGSPKDKRVNIIKLVEKILYSLMRAPNPETIATLQRVVNVVQLADPEVHTYTNMEKIKELPFINWDQALTTYVFDVQAQLGRQVDETDAIYWERMGNFVIDVYNRKIKPHIFPNGLEANLNAAVEEPPVLVPFSVLFNDADDAGYALSIGDDIPMGMAPGQYNQLLYPFDITRNNLRAQNAQFKRNIMRGYQRIHAYVIKSLKELFGIGAGTPYVVPLAGGNLAHAWFADGVFSDQRKELCKKALLLFAYLNRGGAGRDTYFEDTALIAPLIGRLTHCEDGKKTGFESTASVALAILSGGDAIVDPDSFDAYITNAILSEFKTDAISALSDHPHQGENTSIVAITKSRHQDFWHVPTAVVAQYPAQYASSDYWFGTTEHTDRFLQYVYQHIYVSPHELVNVVYKHLVKLDQEKRDRFMNFLNAKLSEIRPFADWVTEAVDIVPLIKQRYCYTPAMAAAAAEVARVQALVDAADAEVQRTGDAVDRQRALLENAERIVNGILMQGHPGNLDDAMLASENANVQLIAATHDAEVANRELGVQRAVLVDANEQMAQGLDQNYRFTREGIEKILFYVGYLSWGGDMRQHPLIADWQENLTWLQAHHNDEYLALYTER